MSAITPDINAALVELLSNLSSANNEQRSHAENTLRTVWSTEDRVDILLLFLSQQATNGSNHAANAFSAVLFRRIAIKSPPKMKSVTERQISNVNAGVLSEIRSNFLHGFVSPQSNDVRHKLADAIAELAKEDVPGEWNELLPTLFEATKNPDPSFRESAFRIFAANPALFPLEHMEQLLPVYETGFADTEDDVRIAACTAFVGFFQILPKKTWPRVQPLLPSLMNSLPRFLENGKEQALSSVLEALIDLVDTAPKLFKDMFPTIIEFCSAVANNKELDSAARLSALELLTTFSESSPKMCKSNPAYTQAIVVITLSMMTEVCPDDEEAEEWNMADNTEDDDEEVEYDSGRQALDRVALRLGGDALAGPLFQIITQMLGSSQWRDRQAALMALSSAAEGCRDVLITAIPKILDLIIPTLNDSHSRVQYATCNALGQISTDFADVIQRQAGSRIVPALVSKLTNASVPRVQAHAAAALVNFSENATKETLEPYLDDLLTNLLTLLQSPKRYVQEQVLTTIAIVADAAEKKFIKYYDTLMPLLINVLKADMGDENKLLKAKCIECSTLIALAVGKEKFAPHSQELIQLFGALQQSDLQDDDPVKPYLEQGWGRLARIIGKEFLPFLPAVLPPLVEAAKASQDISLLDEEEADEFNQNDDWDVIQLGGKHIAVHTALLDDKAAAIDLIAGYADILKGDFYPYTREITVEIALPALDFYLHDDVRRAAASALPSLLLSSKEATGQKSTNTLELWQLIADKLIKTIGNEPSPDIQYAYFSAFSDCVEIVGENALSAQQLKSFTACTDGTLKEIYQRVKDREGEDEYNEEVDDEEGDYTDEELCDEINKVLSVVIKSNKVSFLEHFRSMVPTVASFINDENVILKLFGLCVAADLIEYTGEHSSAFAELFLQPIHDSLHHSESSIRQAAAYAVGVAAQCAPNSYAEFSISCMEPLFAITQLADARSEQTITSTENACTAISKILMAFNSRVPNFDALVDNWIKTLPVLKDTEAAPFAYRFLSQLIESGHQSVQSNARAVIDSVVQALTYNSIGGKNAEAVAASTKKLLGQLPQSEAMALLQGYPVETQQVIQKWFA